VSAPQSHDPLVVNTQDGSCWLRQAVTRGGKGLYALAGTVAGAPDVVLATMADLAEHGLSSVAFALPMPVGPTPRTLDTVEDELTGVSLSLYEEELVTARLRLALASAQRGRREARAEVAELRARTGAPLKGRARLDELTVERAEATHWKRLGLEDQHDSPLHRTDRIPHDLEYTPNTVAHVVAYRDPHRPQTLLCREHGPRYIGMFPVTAEDLPDGGMCTYGGLSSLACGRDVLADGAELGGSR
jgi:hypothetical protein